MNGERELHVVFGMGPAGIAVARALLSQGMQVRLVSRTGSRRQELPPEVQVVAADLSDPAQARAAAAGAAVVYQCVGAPYHRWPELLPPLQTAIVQAAEESGARLVALENLYMYGAVTGPMHEDLPYRATTRKGRVRAAMAEELIQAHERGRVPVAIGRASDFYGPGVTESSLGAMVFRPLLLGKASWAMGNPDLLHSYSFIDDVGRGLARLGLDGGAFGRIWHLPTAPAMTTRELIHLAASEAGMRATVRSLGSLAILMGGLFSPSTREVKEMLYQFQRPFVLDDSRYSQGFGAEATPLDEGLRQTLHWYQSVLHHAV